ncbi:peptidase M48-like protein [Chitinophaga skermanii]|uniref:Peptidase M48-like protein n=1 Tax=Chitinophaga skermanii TaxID=331697 RepID=A0A327QQQ2_9BACT|nr:M48 family metallopeptidase [Chitinophaga skermanii]RAJ04117.1 peptidase M48-like protein [Chitinophaga skermanii]
MSFTTKAQYISPKDSAPKPADVAILSDKLDIQLTGTHGEELHVYWFWDNIEVVKESVGSIELRYKGYPAQHLVVQSMVFNDLFFAAWKKKNKLTFMRKHLPYTMKAWLVMCSALIGLLVVAYFFIVPFLANLVLNNIPKDWEIELGNNSYNVMAKEFTIDSSRTKLVNDFWKTMDVNSVYPIQITVVKDTILNAFALPGGHIVVYSKLLDKMNSGDELAALLSHEFSHIELRHTTRTFLRSTGTYILISSLFGSLDGIAAVLVENAKTLKSLQYSRKLETEADDNGMEELNERGIPLRGFIDLFKTLKGAGQQAPSEWLSSHPNLENRISNVEAQMEYQFPKHEDRLEKMDSIWKEIKTTGNGEIH